MKIGYVNWGYKYDNNIINAFNNYDIDTVDIIYSKEASIDKNSLKQKIEECEADIIFSVNFFSEISNFCEENGIPYVSWVLELPNYDLYTESVKNECNFLQICDSYLAKKLMSYGVGKVFYLPDAIERREYKEVEYKQRGVAFIGNVCDDVLDTSKLGKYSHGYMEAFLHSQRVLNGHYILENDLINNVRNELLISNPIPEYIDSFFDNLYLADYYISSRCDNMTADVFSHNNHKYINLYSDEGFESFIGKRFPSPHNDENYETICSANEFIVIKPSFKYHDAMSRDFLSAVASGGFPLVAYQPDYNYFFKQDENIACYKSEKDFGKILMKYGNNEEDYKKLKKSMFETVMQYHTYDCRIRDMLNFWSTV